MARMYPQRLDPETKSQAERTLYEAFRDTLADEYVIFHSVRWLLRDTRDGAKDGEADFVLAHAERGLLVVEVKGGRVRFDGTLDRWFSNDNEIKDPFEQAEGNKHSLLRKLKETPYWRDRWVTLGHVVAFPDGVVAGDLRLDAPREIILDALDLGDLGGWAVRALTYYSGVDARASAPGPDGVRALIDLLSPSRDIPRPLSVAISQESREIIRLTEEQFQLLDMLSYQRRAAISGCAGSGKTTLALEQARRLGTQGFRVLLTCFNVHMADYFRGLRLPPSVRVASFHQLCRDMAGQAGLPTEPTRGQTPAEFLATLPETLLAAGDRLGPQFDALVVDEGQDFQPDWWLPLQALLADPDRGILYAFYDDNQNLYQTVGGPPPDLRLLGFPLTRNLRNTQFIHRTFLPFYHSTRVPQAIGPEGRRPEVAFYRSESRLKLLLGQVLHRLLVTERVLCQDAVILTPRSADKSVLARWGYVGNTRFTLRWPSGPGEVHYTSVYRFKGLESPVVIVIELHSSEVQDIETLLYVACSRARNHLVLLVEESIPDAVRDQLPEEYQDLRH